MASKRCDFTRISDSANWMATPDRRFCFLGSMANYRQYVLEIRHLGPYAFLVFGLLMIGVTLIPGAPTSAVALIIGACLGHWGGFVVNAIGLTIGNLLQVQLFARVRNHRSKKPDSRVYRALIKMQHPALGVLIGYAVPMIPTAFVNLAAGDTHLTPRAQGLACFGDSTIVAFIYAFAGDLLILKQDWKSLLILLIVAVVIGLTEYGIRMRRSDKARQKVEQFDALN